MAQLAGDDLTRQAIFLIETGKTRPSPQTLELIASRTGKSASYFKARTPRRAPGGEPPVDPRIEELQALCLQQQFDNAIALGLQVLDDRPAPRVEAHVRQYVAQALVRSSRPDEALEHLRRAHELLLAQPDPWLAVECADWEACALYLREDPRALSVAEHALRLCRSTEPRLPGTEARILEHIATIHAKSHDYDRAVEFYNEALRTAGAVRDLRQLGRTYHGLSMAYQERGEMAKAIEYTHKALALYALENDTALLARGENELGLLMMAQGSMEKAEEAFRSALGHLDQARTERTKSHVLLSLAELRLKTGQLEAGLQTAAEAVALARRLDERLSLAAGHQLLAQLHERRHDRQLADREFQHAIRLLEANGFGERLTESHAAYAQVLEARGDARRAARHWKQAASLALGRRDRTRSSGAL